MVHSNSSSVPKGSCRGSRPRRAYPSDCVGRPPRAEFRKCIPPSWHFAFFTTVSKAFRLVGFGRNVTATVCCSGCNHCGPAKSLSPGRSCWRFAGGLRSSRSLRFGKPARRSGSVPGGSGPALSPSPCWSAFCRLPSPCRWGFSQFRIRAVLHW